MCTAELGNWEWFILEMPLRFEKNCHLLNTAAKYFRLQLCPSIGKVFKYETKKSNKIFTPFDTVFIFKMHWNGFIIITLVMRFYIKITIDYIHLNGGWNRDYPHSNFLFFFCVTILSIYERISHSTMLCFLRCSLKLTQSLTSIFSLIIDLLMYLWIDSYFLFYNGPLYIPSVTNEIFEM